MKIYVDAKASRQGNGSKEMPFKHINDAAQVAVAGDEVLVAPGIYREYVNPQNAGTEESRITYRSTEPLGAVITGAGLDVVARDELLEMLREFMEKDEERSILISSHISSDLETLCDDLYMIHVGKIILHEDTDVLLSDYGLLKADREQYAGLDKEYILRRKKESYGYSCLTNQKQYYVENYPGIVIEKGNIDEVITMMIRGERL